MKTRVAATEITHHAPRITHHAPRITHHAPRITHHAPRITPSNIDARGYGSVNP